MRIYIHVPFCISKCYYCSFYSMNRLDLVPAYLSALRTEFAVRGVEYGIAHPGSLYSSNIKYTFPNETERKSEECSHSHLDSIYIGGGTPSALSAEQMDEMLGIFDGYDVEEYTVEMNPDTVTADKAESLVRHGVNRVSLGVQSTNNAVLKMIGRTHDFETVERALEILHRHGIDNISLDFITGFFGQNEEDADTFVGIAERYAVHVSVYSLEYSGKKIKVLEEEQERALYRHLLNRLEKAGFHRYEISNFARPGFESRHNSAYWRREPYLGLGPGAASFDGKKRVQNLPDLQKYIDVYREIREGGLTVQSGITRNSGTSAVRVAHSDKAVFSNKTARFDRTALSDNISFSDDAASSGREVFSDKVAFFGESEFFDQEGLFDPIKEISKVEVLDAYDERIEDLILPLRTVKGVDLHAYREKHGISLDTLHCVRKYLKEGLCLLTETSAVTESSNGFGSLPFHSPLPSSSTASFLSLSARGMDLSNSIMVEIMEEMEE